MKMLFLECAVLNTALRRPNIEISVKESALSNLTTPLPALRVTCHTGNPQTNKTKWGHIDALSCFI